MYIKQRLNFICWSKPEVPYTSIDPGNQIIGFIQAWGQTQEKILQAEHFTLKKIK